MTDATPPRPTRVRAPRAPRSTRPRAPRAAGGADLVVAPVADEVAGAVDGQATEGVVERLRGSRLLAPQLAAHIAEHIASDDAPLTQAPYERTERMALPDDRFLDREVSWLAFNQRVLELAEDPDQPLLERVRFLAIFASNLDEFFMVRVAGLKRRIATGIAVTAASGLSPRQVLDEISARTHELTARHSRVFAEQVQRNVVRTLDVSVAEFAGCADVQHPDGGVLPQEGQEVECIHIAI